jgi:hypothetical protein
MSSSVSSVNGHLHTVLAATADRNAMLASDEGSVLGRRGVPDRLQGLVTPRSWKITTAVSTLLQESVRQPRVTVPIPTDGERFNLYGVPEPYTVA